MNQRSLPLYNPRDRGRRTALQNILISISDELRREAPVARGIVDFAVSRFPLILEQNTPLELFGANHLPLEKISPYSFQIFDLVENRRKEVYPTLQELVNQMDLDVLKEPLDNIELIGIDESQVDNPLAHSSMTFLRSVAFRMYRMPDGEPDEAAGPILSEMRLQLKEDVSFENENKLLSYIRNNFIAYISSLTAIAFGRRPFVVQHGPLVRAIGGFSGITFDYETARQLFNIDSDDSGEFDIPANNIPVVNGDKYTEHNMPFSPENATDGDKNLRKFNEFCHFVCGRRCNRAGAFHQSAVPGEMQNGKITKRMITSRRYPGFCLYFWGLRSNFDLARLTETTISSVVERISSATEMTRLVLPNLLAQSNAKTSVENSDLKSALARIGLNRFSDARQRRDLYQQAKRLIDSLRFTDATLFSYILDEAQYTSPVQIYRYRTEATFDEVLADNSLGVRHEFSNILEALFPSEQKDPKHTGYRIMMSYVRTTPLREPIRLEYFDLPKHNPAQNIVGPIYLMSLPYQEYGLPIILYYADKMAHTPKKLVRTIIEREYTELVLQNRFSDPVSIMRILGKLSRNYFEREGR